MPKPNFLYVGAPKCGSTWLFEALSGHPEVSLYPGKYIHFFKDFYDKGLDWYESQFDGINEDHMIGDFETSYMFYDNVVERIAKTYPSMKLVVSLRNPVERDWSAFKFMKSTAQIGENVDLPAAMETAPDFLTLCSSYGTAVERLYKNFDKDQVLILFYDELRSDPTIYMDKVQSFLGISAEYVPENINKKSYKTKSSRFRLLNKFLKVIGWRLRSMGLGILVMRLKRSSIAKAIIFKDSKVKQAPISDSEREFLIQRNMPEIEKLEKVLDINLDKWKV
jgi:hypothetical protein